MIRSPQALSAALLLPILVPFVVPGLVLAWPGRLAAELVAERLTLENIDEHRIGGPDADAGIDDWFLGNGTICAAVSDPSHESPLSPRGGVLIDLSLCGAGNDQWTVFQPMLNLSQSHVVPVSRVEAGRDAKTAWILTSSIFAGVEITTTYSVDAVTPHALAVHTLARRVAEGDSLFSVGALLLHPGGQARPFSLSQSDPESSRGFVYPASDRRSLRSMLGALSSSDVQILVGGDGLPGVSYGVERLSAGLLAGDEAVSPLGTFSVTGSHYTALTTLTRPFWIGDEAQTPGLLQLAQIPFMDVEDGDVLETRYRIWVGARADVASITDQIWASAPRLQGRVDAADPSDARLHIRSATDVPRTEIRPDAEGRYSLRLPPGHYVVHAYAAAGRRATRAFEVVDGEAEQVIPPITLGSPPRVRLPTSYVGRLIFLRADGSGPARFGDDRLGFRVGEDSIPSGLEASFVNRSGSPLDPEWLAIEPGRYRVLAVRGPEHEFTEATLEVVAGQESSLELEPLHRTRPTPGWVAADLHVHSGESFDSSLPQTAQIRAFAASGAEVLVATEHDRVFDPRKAIAETGLAGALVSLTGVEMTSSFEGGDSPYSSGHLNVFPLAADPNAYRGGAPRLEGRRIRDALADVRKSSAGTFVQLNHPRPGPDEVEGDTYLSHVGVDGEPFEPTKPLDQAPNATLIDPGPDHALRDVDFDGLELLNSPSLLRYRRVRADWLSLLLQGERRVATANSDSHRLGHVVGLPRTYVAMRDDRLDHFDEARFVEALRAGRAYGTTGPLLEVQLGDAALGDLYSGERGVLDLTVDAPEWIPIREWRAYVNGELVHRAPIAAGERAQLPLAFASDAFVTVEVEGPATGRYAEALPGFVPFAFTNPIFVDADENGRFEAPGLRDPLPDTLTHPEEPD